MKPVTGCWCLGYPPRARCKWSRAGEENSNAGIQGRIRCSRRGADGASVCVESLKPRPTVPFWSEFLNLLEQGVTKTLQTLLMNQVSFRKMFLGDVGLRIRNFRLRRPLDTPIIAHLIHRQNIVEHIREVFIPAEPSSVSEVKEKKAILM